MSALATTGSRPGAAAGPGAAARSGPSAGSGAARGGGAAGGRGRPGDVLLWLFVALAFAVLLAPVAYIVTFSFNDGGRRNIAWGGFTLDNWRNPCGAPDVCDAVVTSISVGLLATLVATVLGTAIALALVRYEFRGRTPTNLLILLPMTTPEVVLGASLLAQFLNFGVPLGFTTVLLSHVMFCLSFVVVAVRARVSTLEPVYEQASADLYASPAATFWRVTLPLLLPGIAAAALLSFSLSFDDFIITNFNSGSLDTFPKFVYVAARRGVPAEAYVIGSAMFAISLAVVLVARVASLARRTG